MCEEMKIKIAEMIIRTNGNFSTKDFENLGLPFEIFLQMSQVNNERLIEVSKKILKERE